jgi:hypothetical protein
VEQPVRAGTLFDMTNQYGTAVLSAAGRRRRGHGEGAHDAETRLAGGWLSALRPSPKEPISAYSLSQYWVVPPPLDAPLALSCLIRCISMLEELVAPL